MRAKMNNVENKMDIRPGRARFLVCALLLISLWAPQAVAEKSFAIYKEGYDFLETAVGRDGTIYVLARQLGNGTGYLIRYSSGGVEIGFPKKINGFSSSMTVNGNAAFDEIIPIGFTLATNKDDADKDAIYVMADLLDTINGTAPGQSVTYANKRGLLKLDLEGNTTERKDNGTANVSTWGNSTFIDITYNQNDDAAIVLSERGVTQVTVQFPVYGIWGIIFGFSTNYTYTSGGDLDLWRMSNTLNRTHSRSFKPAGRTQRGHTVTTDPVGAIYTTSSDTSGYWIYTIKHKADLSGQVAADHFDNPHCSDEYARAGLYAHGFIYTGGYINFCGGFDRIKGKSLGVLYRYDTNIDSSTRRLNAVLNKKASVVDLAAGVDNKIYATGVMGSGMTTFHDVSPEDDNKHIVGDQNRDLDPANKHGEYGSVHDGSFFIAQLDKDLSWKWIVMPNDIIPEATNGLQVARNPVNNKIMVTGTILGRAKLGTTTIGIAGRESGFLTVLNDDGTFAEQVEFTAQAQISSFDEDADGNDLKQQIRQIIQDVLPFKGQTTVMIKDTDVSASVPELLYLDENVVHLKNATEQQIADNAATRLSSIGYSVEGTATNGTASTYRFAIQQDTTLDFNWEVHFALSIENDLTGTNGALGSPASGDPEPAVKKHWIEADELVIAKIDGAVLDATADGNGTRYVSYAYWAGGAADNAGKSRGTGNILGIELDDFDFTIESGNPGSKAGVVIPGSNETNESLAFTAKTAGAAENAYTIKYVSGAAESAAFAGNTLTVTVKEGTSTGDTVKATVNGLGASPFVAADAPGSDGSAKMNLHGSEPSVQAEGGVDAVAAWVITDDFGTTNSLTFTVAAEIAEGLPITFHSVTDSASVGAEWVGPTTSDPGSLKLNIKIGETTASQVVSAIQAKAGTAMTVTPSSNFTFVAEPPDAIIKNETATVVVQHAFGAKVTAKTAGVAGNSLKFKYKALAATAASASYTAASKILEINYGNGVGTKFSELVTALSPPGGPDGAAFGAAWTSAAVSASAGNNTIDGALSVELTTPGDGVKSHAVLGHTNPLGATINALRIEATAVGPRWDGLSIETVDDEDQTVSWAYVAASHKIQLKYDFDGSVPTTVTQAKAQLDAALTALALNTRYLASIGTDATFLMPNSVVSASTAGGLVGSVDTKSGVNVYQVGGGTPGLLMTIDGTAGNTTNLTFNFTDDNNTAVTVTPAGDTYTIATDWNNDGGGRPTVAALKAAIDARLGGRGFSATMVAGTVESKPANGLQTRGGAEAAKTVFTIKEDGADRITISANTAAAGNDAIFVDTNEATATAQFDAGSKTVTFGYVKNLTTAQNMIRAFGNVKGDPFPYTVSLATGTTNTTKLDGDSGYVALKAGSDSDGVAATLTLQANGADAIVVSADQTGTALNALKISGSDGGAIASSFAGSTLTVTYQIGTSQINDVIIELNKAFKANSLPYTATLAGGATGTDPLNDIGSNKQLSGGLDPDVTVTFATPPADRFTLTLKPGATPISGLVIAGVNARPPPVVTVTGSAPNQTIEVEIIGDTHTATEVATEVNGHAGASVLVTAAVPTGAGGDVPIPAGFGTNAYSLANGAEGVKATATLSINHSAHSSLTIQALQPATKATVSGNENAPLNGVGVSIVSGALGVTYTGGTTMVINAAVGSATAGEVATMLNAHDAFNDAWKATASGDGKGAVVATSPVETTGGVDGSNATGRITAERGHYLEFTPAGAESIKVRFVEQTGGLTPQFDESKTPKEAIFPVTANTKLSELKTAAEALEDSNSAKVFGTLTLAGDGNKQAFSPGAPELTIKDNSKADGSTVKAFVITLANGSVSRRAFGLFNPAGDNNELTFVARNFGTQANGYRVAFVAGTAITIQWYGVDADANTEDNILWITYPAEGATANAISREVAHQDLLRLHFATGPQFPIRVSNENLRIFPNLEERQQVPQFVMDRPGSIRYDWKTQYRISVSTSSSKSQQLPLVYIEDPSACRLNSNADGCQKDARGTGEHWFDRGTALKVGGRFLGSSQNMQGWRSGFGHFPIEGDVSDLEVFLLEEGGQTVDYRVITVDRLSLPTIVQFDYGDRIFDERITIGDAINFAGVSAARLLSATHPEHLGLRPTTNLAPQHIAMINMPAGSIIDNTQAWDDVADKAYPLRPGQYQVEWPTSDPDQNIITRVASGFAGRAVPTSVNARVSRDLSYVEIRGQYLTATGTATNVVLATLRPKSGVNPRDLRLLFSDINNAEGSDTTDIATPTINGGQLNVALNFGHTSVKELVTKLDGLAGLASNFDAQAGPARISSSTSAGVLTLSRQTINTSERSVTSPFLTITPSGSATFANLVVEFKDAKNIPPVATATAAVKDNVLTITADPAGLTQANLKTVINNIAGFDYTATTPAGGPADAATPLVMPDTVLAGDRYLATPKMWTHIADSPAVDLDPKAGDEFYFRELPYTESSALITDDGFAAAGLGHSVMVFTKATGGTAVGNLELETLHIRAVRTKPWYEGLKQADATVGSKISSADDTAGLGSGYVFDFGGQPRFNPNIYDRNEITGPVIPVNAHYNTGAAFEVPQPNSSIDVHRDDIVICWYENHSSEPQINWPYQSVKYNVTWPDVGPIAANNNGYKRIVIASMLGSEGKKFVHDSNIAGTAPEDQHVFDPDLYDELLIYNQPNPAEPGYNPNEEHALLAVSFKSRAQAGPPQAAFALRNDLNHTTQNTSYTSDPFVLVQYRDVQADEIKMWVYSVETVDTRQQYAYTISGVSYDYTFKLPARAGEPVAAPYPLDQVIGITPCAATYGVDDTSGANNQKVYFEDHKGFAWAVSGSNDANFTVEYATDEARFNTHWFYPLQPEFWNDRDYNGDNAAERPGECVPLLPVGSGSSTLAAAIGAGGDVVIDVASATSFSVGDHVSIIDGSNTEHGLRIKATSGNQLTIDEVRKPKRSGSTITKIHSPTPVLYVSEWPEQVATLKVGETLTFSGGEFRSDNPTSYGITGNAFATPGLPGVVAWSAGEVIFDTENVSMLHSDMKTKYTARLIRGLSGRTVNLDTGDYPADLEPASGKISIDQGKFFYNDLTASTQKRFFYDPLTQELGWKGFLNNKSIEDDTLTQAPPAVYVLEPNVMTPEERDEIKLLSTDGKWKTKVAELYELTRDPNGVGNGNTEWLPGLQLDSETGRVEQEQALGIGLALVANSSLLSPNATAGVRYVSLAENNHPDLGDAPITVHIVRVVVGDKTTAANNPGGLTAENFRYRGALKTVLSKNVFDEKIILRHTADYGGNAPSLAFEWYYRGEDGATHYPPDGAAPGTWQVFGTPNTGIGQFQIIIAGAGALLLRDNLFFMRYRHSAEDFAQADRSRSNFSPFQWVGAGNSRPPKDGQLGRDTYIPQLVPGWVKRVLDAVNPYEARISDFTNEQAPSTVVSMIQQLGQRYEGPVALNPDKNVIENVGLIELYSTVLDRAQDLSINLITPIVDSGVNSAILLASTRISEFYMLLGNESYQDALDPTIGYGSSSVEYGHLAPTVFAFQNQLDSLTLETLALMRGTDEFHARPVYNRMMWNYAKGEGEPAYNQVYNINDVDRNGFINEADARVQYPQGHGDAWGHYLTAIRAQYNLLKHEFYKWESRAELYNLEDIVIDVDYRDERKFAEMAAAKARCGAEVVKLVYRDKFVDDPDGQWQGYTDTDEDRAWGVEGWARRAGQGALFDWITANALLPYEHPEAEFDNIQKVDRQSVNDIDLIALELAEVEASVDAANNGNNPLGVSPGAVPFDLDPSFLEVSSTIQGEGHFVQIYNRAVVALQNASAVFEYANDIDNMLRETANSAEEFALDVEEQDRAFLAELIEFFGMPYAGTVGAGKIYPEGYNGPDLITYQYVDIREITGATTIAEVVDGDPSNDGTVPLPHAGYVELLQKFKQGVGGGDLGKHIAGFHGIDDAGKPISNGFVDDSIDAVLGAIGFPTVDPLADLYAPFFLQDLDDAFIPLDPNYFQRGVVELNLPRAAKSYSFQAPTSWGQRPATGSIQEAIREMLLIEAELFQAIAAYDGMVGEFRTTFNDLNQLAQISTHSIANMQAAENYHNLTQNLVVTGELIAELLDDGDEVIEEGSDAIEDAVPDNFIAGLAAGGDTFAPAKGILAGLSAIGGAILDVLGAAAKYTPQYLEIQKDIADMQIERIEATNEASQGIREAFHDLQNALGDEPAARIAIFEVQERHRQAADALRTDIADAFTLVAERKAFNMKTAAAVQKQRYQDMTFRVTRNNSLRKYQQAYDLAARYVFLAARAYDYETNLPDDHFASATGLYEAIIEESTLGVLDDDGEPVPGLGGLAGILGKLKANYNVFEPQFAMNNADVESNGFSLRTEFFRIKSDSANDAAWRNALADSSRRVDNLWDNALFRRYCLPVQEQTAGDLHGIIIEIPTEITAGKNFFGHDLGPGDNAYDPSHFSHRVAAAAVAFENYDTSLLANTPRAYLVPTGTDIMYIPGDDTLQTRRWQIDDQAIPAPFRIGLQALESPEWRPSVDTLNEGMSTLRRHGTQRILGTTTVNTDDLTYSSRLIGRTVWNTRWVLFIPGSTMLANSSHAIDTLIYGKLLPGKSTADATYNPATDRDGNGIKDIKIYFSTYGYTGI